MEFLNVFLLWLKPAFTTLVNNVLSHPNPCVLFRVNLMTPDFTLGGGEKTCFRNSKKIFCIIICLQENTYNAISFIPGRCTYPFSHLFLKHPANLNNYVSVIKNPEEYLCGNVIGEITYYSQFRRESLFNIQGKKISSYYFLQIGEIFPEKMDRLIIYFYNPEIGEITFDQKTCKDTCTGAYFKN